LGKYQDKIIVIPNGINIEHFNISCSKEECREKLGLELNKNIILFVGNLIQYKGPDILVRAASIVVKEIPDIELIFVGSGNMRNELEELSKKLGVEKHVKFAGFVEERLKLLYYKAADIFCLPSIMSTESFGIVNLEALACGLPIVASAIGGIPDIVKDGVNGLLVSPKNPGALADAITYLLKNEDVRRKMGKKGREMVKKYSWEEIAGRMEKIYKELINASNSPPCTYTKRCANDKHI
jgi:glycosyltransferase involved in cell wall biosynthesis